MIQSMTGFGRAQVENDQLSVSAEVKTLNSKFADTTIKMSHVFSDKEIELRNILGSKLQRGKIILSVSYSSRRAENLKANINQEVVKAYYAELAAIAKAVGTEGTENLLSVVMELPEVYSKDNNMEVVDQDWPTVKKVIEEAVANCSNFRTEEGKSLEAAFRESIEKIQTYLAAVEERDPERLVKVREKLRGQVQELVESDNFDPNRFEQELIYYIEKLDIAEEKVRLKNHLNYFVETLESSNSNGKKLGFISQEIGREINTIGSKANDLEIQKLVVNMKEELEKIKEQVLNVL
ncbi:YicC/YloC family endoribonuclease [Limibacter armeniacum]|uniref:YicC/YloC family endoribonuclease n=1 Tax=Limibacter armeniacum TaxID=466084 RepID=UPI002FE5F9D0